MKQSAERSAGRNHINDGEHECRKNVRINDAVVLMAMQEAVR